MELSTLTKKVDLSGGEWVDEIPDHPGLRLKVRSANYKPYRVASSGFYRRNSKVIQTDEGLVETMPDTGKHMAEHLLVDWDMTHAKGPYALTDKGKPVPYSTDVALHILTLDDDHGIGGEYRSAVLWAANKVAENLAATTKAVSGN